jgi:hypothetical protein
LPNGPVYLENAQDGLGLDYLISTTRTRNLDGIVTPGDTIHDNSTLNVDISHVKQVENNAYGSIATRGRGSKQAEKYFKTNLIREEN